MRDVYVLTFRDGTGYNLGGSQIVCIADDFDRASAEMARFTADQQARMKVENHDLLEEGD